MLIRIPQIHLPISQTIFVATRATQTIAIIIRPCASSIMVMIISNNYNQIKF